MSAQPTTDADIETSIEFEVAGATETVAERRPPSLWRNWRFQALWIGSGTSLLGLTAADFAYPVVILLMTAWSVSGCALIVGEKIRYDWCGHIFTPCNMP